MVKSLNSLPLPMIRPMSVVSTAYIRCFTEASSEGGTSADGLGAAFYALEPHLLSPTSQEAGDQLTGGCRHLELGEVPVEDLGDDGLGHQAEVHKKDPHIHLWLFKVMQNVAQSDIEFIIH